MAEHVRYIPVYKELYRQRKEKIERVFADAKEKHGMRYTQYRGLARVTNWVKLKFAAMNLKSWRSGNGMTAIRSRMAEGGPKHPKMHLFFRCFFPLSFYLLTENLLWPECQSRFFDKLTRQSSLPRVFGSRLLSRRTGLSPCRSPRRLSPTPRRSLRSQASWCRASDFPNRPLSTQCSGRSSSKRWPRSAPSQSAD